MKNREHTRPVTTGFTRDTTPPTIDKAEVPTYIITHQSHPTLKAVTITYKGDIGQWIKDNQGLYITHLYKLPN
jgi:hypothetical protein